MNNTENEEKYNPDGIVWWKIGGATRRIAAYLWHNVPVGSTFTLAQVREATGTELQTQSDRRLRELREQGWRIVGYKDDPTLETHCYRLEICGNRVWLGEKNERDYVSAKIRRQVFFRDSNTCVICGVSAGESYPDRPELRARMTIGHRIPNQRLGEATLENLQTECARCNEAIRDLLDDPLAFEDVKNDIAALTSRELLTLQQWVTDGKRNFTNMEMLFSQIRYMSSNERNKVELFIQALVDEYHLVDPF